MWNLQYSYLRGIVRSNNLNLENVLFITILISNHVSMGQVNFNPTMYSCKCTIDQESLILKTISSVPYNLANKKRALFRLVCIHVFTL